MFNTLFGLIAIASTVVAGLGGYFLARTFVRRRLRFVDAIRSPAAPLVAGAVAFLLALLPAALLPILTTTTAVVFGIGTAFGTASGVKALDRADWTGRQLRP
jgi:uncharacterized membrane protein